MKIALCLFKYFPYGGLQSYFLKIWEECERRGHETRVFAREWEGAKPGDLDLKLIPVRALTNTGKNVAFAEKLRNLLLKNNFDGIVGFNKMPGLNIYVQADTCYAAQVGERQNSLPWSQRRHRHFQKYEEAVFGENFSTHILLLSEREKVKYQKFYGTPEEQFTLLQPPFEIKSSSPLPLHEGKISSRKKLGLGENDLLFLFVASNFKSKGLDRVLRAFQSLPPKIRGSSYLYVVGADRSLKHQWAVRLLARSPRIKFLGARSDLIEFYLAADLLVHPARLENTGTVIVEAIRAGLPVLATEVCGYSVHIEKAGAGKVLSSPFSQEECNQLLREMITSPNREIWSRNGIKYAALSPAPNMQETAVDVIEAIASRKAKKIPAPS